MQIESEYDERAEKFLTGNGIKFKATLSDTKSPPWEEGEDHGHHYRVTLSKEGTRLTAGSRLTFDFWGSIADKGEGKTEVSAYTVLACISGDVNCPSTFKDFCSEYGYDDDSIKAQKAFRRCFKFSVRLKAFLTPAEIEQLVEIQ